MLVMFRVKNFMSFKDDVILDLRKSSFKEHQEHTFETNCGMNLLKTLTMNVINKRHGK